MTRDSDFYHPQAVVLGLGINGLGIVRSLGVHDIEIHGVYNSENELGRFSRYVNAVKFSELQSNTQVFLEKLINEFGDVNEKPILFADNDLYVLFMSQYSEQLQEYFRFILPKKEVLNTLTSKNLSSAYVSERGLHVPKTYQLKDIHNMEKILSSIEYPCLVKPVNSTLTLEKKVLIYSSETLLREFLLKNPNIIDRLIIQEIIPGEDSCIYQATTYVSKDGIISPIFTMRKIRQNLPGFGITSYGISKNITPIKEIVHSLLRTTDYRGFISIEFKQHPDSGDLYYIETNPRLPYYHQLIHDAGINLPYLCYQDMLNLYPSRETLHDQKNDIRWMCFSQDLVSFYIHYSENKLSLRHWLLSVIRVRSFAFFNKNDLKPFLIKCFELFKLIIKKVVTQMGIGVPEKKVIELN